jgi:hypothetical protein
MPDTQAIVSIIAVILLAWIAWQAGRILTRLARIEARLAEFSPPVSKSVEMAAVPEAPAGSAFEAFLAEEPARRALPKSEQFAAFRKWRREKGLNWANS